MDYAGIVAHDDGSGAQSGHHSEIGEKALIERQFGWLPAGRESILWDMWGMLAQLQDNALRDPIEAC